MASMVAAAIRQDDRYPVRLRVDCTSRDAFTAGYATNLSRGGLFIASEKPLPPDSALELTLVLPSSARIRALGRVVWDRDPRKSTCPLTPGMGVKFLSLSRADWGQLVEFLAGLPAPALTRPAMRLLGAAPALR
jgi:uncharacterized protein (TIGR02266 family)